MICPHCKAEIGNIEDNVDWQGDPPSAEMQADPNFAWLVLCGLCAYLFVYVPKEKRLVQASPEMLEEAPPGLLNSIRQRQRAIYLTRARN